MTNRPCVTEHLRNYPLNPNSADLKALTYLDESWPDNINGQGATLVTAIYRQGGEDNYTLRALIIQDSVTQKFAGLGGPALVETGEIISQIGPDGGTNSPDEPMTVRFSAAANQNTLARSAQLYLLGAMDFTTMSPALGGDNPARLFIQAASEGLAADRLTGLHQWAGLPSYPDGGVLVIKVSASGSNVLDQYLRRDGTTPMTGDLNMGGNKLKNLAKVQAGTACDGINPASTESKAMAGQLATLDPIAADPAKPAERLGAGYTLVCRYESAMGGYVWGKATAGPTSIEDAQGGLMEGWYSIAQFQCFRYANENVGWTNGTGTPVNGGIVPASASYNGVNQLFFLVKNGQIWAYIAVNINNWANGYMLAGGPYSTGGEYNSQNYPPIRVIDFMMRPGIVNPLDAYTCRAGFGWWFPDGSPAAPAAPGAGYGYNPLDQYFMVFNAWQFGPDGVRLTRSGSVSRKNGVPGTAVLPNSDGNGLPYSANNTQDNLGDIPVTVAGTTNTQVVTGCTLVRDSFGAVTDVNCSKQNVAVNSTGQTTPRPANFGTAYDPNANAAPVRTYTAVPIFDSQSFAFQRSGSNCMRVGGVSTGALIKWGDPPASFCYY